MWSTKNDGGDEKRSARRLPVLCFPCHIRRDQHAVGGLFYSSWKNALTPNPPPGAFPHPTHTHTARPSIQAGLYAASSRL